MAEQPEEHRLIKTRFSPDEIAIRCATWMGYALYMMSYAIGWLPNNYQVLRNGVSKLEWYWSTCGVCEAPAGEDMKNIKRKNSTRPKCKECNNFWRWIRIRLRPIVEQEQITWDTEISGNIQEQMIALKNSVETVTNYTTSQLEAIADLIRKSR